LHTDESLTTVYYARGRYLPQGLDEIDYILRDHRNEKIKAIDPRLLDLLFTLGMKLDTQHPFHVISGYRSPETNEMLYRRNRGVARNSLHIYGKAVDVRIPGCELSLFCRAARECREGGVGYYPRSDFLHIDVGQVRYW
jgi:uncharacterized protein YcbK (DUF882 family)